jgi:hypothetical protein
MLESYASEEPTYEERLESFVACEIAELGITLIGTPGGAEEVLEASDEEEE